MVTTQRVPRHNYDKSTIINRLVSLLTHGGRSLGGNGAGQECNGKETSGLQVKMSQKLALSLLCTNCRRNALHEGVSTSMISFLKG